MSRHGPAVVSVLGLLLAACGQDPSPVETADSPSPSVGSPTTSSSQSPSPASSPSRSRTVPDGTRIMTAGSDYGPMLFDRTGQAIYLFDKERSSRPECYGACAEAWPPVLTTGAPRAVGDTRATLLGTTKRSDGGLQVTYSGHPLYFYAHEGKFQVLCHDIEEFGGVWLVVQPDGRPAP